MTAPKKIGFFYRFDPVPGRTCPDRLGKERRSGHRCITLRRRGGRLIGGKQVDKGRYDGGTGTRRSVHKLDEQLELLDCAYEESRVFDLLCGERVGDVFVMRDVENWRDGDWELEGFEFEPESETDIELNGETFGSSVFEMQMAALVERGIVVRSDGSVGPRKERVRSVVRPSDPEDARFEDPFGFLWSPRIEWDNPHGFVPVFF